MKIIKKILVNVFLSILLLLIFYIFMNILSFLYYKILIKCNLFTIMFLYVALVTIILIKEFKK